MKLKTVVLLSTGSLLWLVILGVVTANIASEKPVVAQTAAVVQAPVETQPDLDELAVLVNAERARVGLPALVRDPILDTSATAKCDDMVAGSYWGHVNAAGKHGYEYIRGRYVVSENLSARYYNAKAVNDGWMGSKPHHDAILDTRYGRVGYALCDVTGYKNSIVQHFSD